MSKWEKDLTGKQIGMWTVLERSEKIYYWRCRCNCDAVHDVYYSSLLLGKSRGCHRCMSAKAAEKAIHKRIGQRHGRLTILKVDKSRENTAYICQCDCGKICSVTWGNLSSGKTKSCGCVKRERDAKEKDRLIKYSKEFLKKDRKDGTSLSSLKSSKVSKSSTTKVRGVSLMKNGKYRAYLYLRRKQIHLGTYDTLEEAAQARKEGEEKYFTPILEKYGNN